MHLKCFETRPLSPQPRNLSPCNNENPPPYEPEPVASKTADTDTSATTKASPTPLFHIRQTIPKDAAAVHRCNEKFGAHSPRATRETSASLDVVKKSIVDPSIQNIVQIVAVPITPPNHGALNISGLVRKFKNYTVDTKPKSAEHKQKDPDITNGMGTLGYAILIPYIESIGILTKCYQRTATLYVYSLEQDVLGDEMYWDVNRALIDETLERSREQGDRYKTVVTRSSFSEDEPALVRWREVLLDREFTQVGHLKGVLKK